MRQRESEVVRQGGFSQAAKVVFATQSTVSKSVKQLEDELGVPLLDRAGHRSTLTDAGEIVYRRALKILAERDDLLAELDELCVTNYSHRSWRSLSSSYWWDMGQKSA